MALVSPRRLPVGIRGNSTGCYRAPQQWYRLMESSPGVGVGGGMRGVGKLRQVSLLRLSGKMLVVTEPDPLLDQEWRFPVTCFV